MWCLALTSPCCCGPCQTRITTGAKIVFLLNQCVWALLLLFSIYPLMSLHTAIVCGFMSMLNICAISGLRKRSDFLPVPDTWRSRMRLRDKHQFCLLIPWIIIYSFITLCWSIMLVPVLVLASSKLYNHGDDPFTICLLMVFLAIAVILPYQLTVVLRCTRVVRKGGQHYVIPEPSPNHWAVGSPRSRVEDTASISTQSTQSTSSRL